jgi:aspartyl-tRNA(Asn)/glutamyl-tRNA(Gln) amidotransferase subunit A
MTIADAASALRARKISCAELVEESLNTIDKLNARLNAFITVTADAARERARALDRELAGGLDRGPLHGIPIAHKDLICTKGIRTTSGSKLFENDVPKHDAAVVEKLEAAGAVMVGKTGLHELAYGITSDNPHFGSIRNPWDTERIPGGSSGGSGAAVATGMVFMATGTDTGGSIRIPASYCGTVGLKPTYDRVSRLGVRPLGLSLDHVGPLTRTVRDAAVTFAAMAPSTPAEGLRHPLRIGLPENFYFDQVDPEVRSAVRAAAKKSEEIGAKVEPVRVPDIEALNLASFVILLSEASAAYAPYLDRRGDFGADVLALLDQGRLIPATSYVNAQRVRKMLVDDFRALFARIDVLYTPTTPTPPARIGQMEVEIDGAMHNVRLVATRFARGINLLGFPAISMPCGFTNSGLPIGLQLIGRPFEDEMLLDWCAQLEDTLGFQVALAVLPPATKNHVLEKKTSTLGS